MSYSLASDSWDHREIQALQNVIKSADIQWVKLSQISRRSFQLFWLQIFCYGQ